MAVHADVAETIDAMLRSDALAPEMRWRDEGGVHRSQARPRPGPRSRIPGERFGGLLGAPAETSLGGQLFHCLRFIGVQTAAMTRENGAGHKLSRNACVRTPSNTCAVGPDIHTPSSRQSISKVPPSRSTRTAWLVSPKRAAATAVAQEDEPEASVMPVPRSQTRIRI